MTFLLILFPDGTEPEVEMSPALLEALRLTPDAQPRTLDQWRELCHPADHGAIQELEDAIQAGRGQVSLTRRLYCGDGVYRAFRLDAWIHRGPEGPLCLMGLETEEEPKGLQALEEENLLLRRALQRQAIRLLRLDVPEEEFVVGVAGSGAAAFVKAMGGRVPEGIRLVNGLPPELDAALYLAPIRTRLGAEERELIARLPERRALLLAQADLERDDTEAGRVVLSRGEKLARNLAELREAAGAPVFPIPSQPEGGMDLVLRLLSAWAFGGPAPEEGVIPPAPPSPPEETGPFAPLLFSMREEGLRSHFLALPVGRRLALLGPRRDSLRLFSRLIHDAALAEQPFPEDAWLFAGRGEAPFPCLRLECAVEGLDLLIAPEGGKVPSPEWTPVVHVNLAAGWDRASSPKDGVLACADGGLFDNRLEDLAPVAQAGAKAWFIYENYDARYTDFPSLAGHVRPDSTDGELEALAGLWGECGLSYHPPFTRQALGEALARVRAAKEGNSLGA